MPSPVFSLGFEIVEPDATLPAYGGTPVESTYKVTLFNGVTVVGEFVFNSIPNDVVAFIGVWSDTRFDRVAIVDVTESPFADDDEYFGEFYTGAQPAPPTTTSLIIATGAPVPGASGTFATFPQSPAVGSTIAAFLGMGSGGQAGIYARAIPPDPVIPPDPIIPVVDLTTPIPGGAGLFTGFTQLAASGTVVDFRVRQRPGRRLPLRRRRTRRTMPGDCQSEHRHSWRNRHVVGTDIIATCRSGRPP